MDGELPKIAKKSFRKGRGGQNYPQGVNGMYLDHPKNSC